jgi:hypothetical protein
MVTKVLIGCYRDAQSQIINFWWTFLWFWSHINAQLIAKEILQLVWWRGATIIFSYT